MDLQQTEDDQSFADLAIAYQEHFFNQDRIHYPPILHELAGRSAKEFDILSQYFRQQGITSGSNDREIGPASGRPPEPIWFGQKPHILHAMRSWILDASHARDRPEMEQPTPKWRRLGLIASHNIPHHFSGIV